MYLNLTFMNKNHSTLRQLIGSKTEVNFSTKLFILRTYKLTAFLSSESSVVKYKFSTSNLLKVKIFCQLKVYGSCKNSSKTFKGAIISFLCDYLNNYFFIYVAKFPQHFLIINFVIHKLYKQFFFHMTILEISTQIIKRDVL